LKRIERSLIEPSITGHHGKLVKTTGDGFIAIFDSPVEAVRCSIVIQQDMVGRKRIAAKASLDRVSDRRQPWRRHHRIDRHLR